jgi:histone deacetylase 1/2
MDSGATTHVTNQPGTFTSSYSPANIYSNGIVVGNGSTLPIYSVDNTTLSSKPFYLNHVLYSPSDIKNLNSVHKFTRDNHCSVEFNPYGFCVKDLATRKILLTSSSSSDLYPFIDDLSPGGYALTVTTTRDLWHRRLGHPGADSFSRLSHNFLDSCNKSSGTSLCEASQLGRQPRLPFSSSSSTSSFTTPLQLIHCDLWTSPVSSFSGYQYYLVVLDDFSHYSWIFPLRNKSDTSSTLQLFFAYIKTQFHVIIKCIQCDNGGSSLTLPCDPSSVQTESPSDSPVYIHLRKTARPTASFAQQTTSFALCSFKPNYPLSFGLKLSTPPPTSSTFAPHDL